VVVSIHDPWMRRGPQAQAARSPGAVIS
jgi:hypothetical protein